MSFINYLKENLNENNFTKDYEGEGLGGMRHPDDYEDVLATYEKIKGDIISDLDNYNLDLPNAIKLLDSFEDREIYDMYYINAKESFPLEKFLEVAVNELKTSEQKKEMLEVITKWEKENLYSGIKQLLKDNKVQEIINKLKP